jgi:hypothetical protein
LRSTRCATLSAQARSFDHPARVGGSGLLHRVDKARERQLAPVQQALVDLAVEHLRAEDRAEDVHDPMAPGGDLSGATLSAGRAAGRRLTSIGPLARVSIG